jgi:predicted branched-subunit amino acid permease
MENEKKNFEQEKIERTTYRKNEFRQGIRDGVPIAVGYLSVSFS